MTSLVTVRLVPLPGEIGCIGACPLCSSTGTGRSYPPCLACREVLRERLEQLQLPYYLARALN